MFWGGIHGAAHRRAHLNSVAPGQGVRGANRRCDCDGYRPDTSEGGIGAVPLPLPTISNLFSTARNLNYDRPSTEQGVRGVNLDIIGR